MFKIFLYVTLLMSSFCFSQCPDKLATYYTEQAQKVNTPKFQLLAQYYSQVCPCAKGSDSPEALKDKLNVLIDKINATTNPKKPMSKVIRCVDNRDVEPQSYVEWNGKKENFNEVVYSGNIDPYFPKQLHLKNVNSDGNVVKTGKKFQYIRISGFQLLNDGESLSLEGNDELQHVGIIDIENDYYYYTAKSATIKGIGGNMYELTANFHLTGSAGNSFQNNPKYPSYELKAFFVFNPIFEMD